MDNATTVLYNAFVSILTASPAIAVAFVGALLALLRRQRHPRASLFALVGFLIYLISSITFPLIYAILPALLYEQGWSTTSYTLFYRGLAFFHYLIEAAALALLLAAVLVGRGAQPNNAERKPA